MPSAMVDAIQLLPHQTKCCTVLRKALTPQEQQQLFDFVLVRDVTDWEGMTRCMNPTPKTLNLSLTVGKGGASDANSSAARTITILDQSTDDDIRSNIDDTDNADRSAKEMVIKLVKTSIAAATSSSSLAEDVTNNNDYTINNNIKSITLSAIRYSPQGMSSTIGHELPPHVDHCNDGSLVILFSLGRTAHFFVQSSSKSTSNEFDMHSGDVLVFDPSSEAGILHGVTGIARDSTNNINDNVGDGPSLGCWEDSRLGVQCRVSFSNMHGSEVFMN